MDARPIIAESARKHGVSDDDMLHAYNNLTKVFDLDEGFMLFIGPAHSARMVEVGVVDGETAPVIIHAMPARDKFLR